VQYGISLCVKNEVLIKSNVERSMFILRDIESGKNVLFKQLTFLDLYEVNVLNSLDENDEVPNIDKKCILSKYNGMSFFGLFIENHKLL